MATLKPAAVVISAWEMPPASERGIADAVYADRREHLDHAHHRAQQAEQRADGGDGTQGIEKALQPVGFVATGVFDRFHHHGALVLHVHQPCGQHPAQRRAFPQLFDLIGVQGLILDLMPNLGDQMPG